ncbi:hypothetical protein ACWGPD_31795, partial [Streptomyces hirsutus]
ALLRAKALPAGVAADAGCGASRAPIPASSVAEGFPELTTEQGDAATRVVTMLLGALEAH